MRGCWAKARARGGGAALEKLAQVRFLIINILFYLQIRFQLKNQFEFKSDFNFERFLIAKLNLIAHNNTKENNAMA
jgi:hypothetical protein